MVCKVMLVYLLQQAVSNKTKHTKKWTYEANYTWVVWSPLCEKPCIYSIQIPSCKSLNIWKDHHEWRGRQVLQQMVWPPHRAQILSSWSRSEITSTQTNKTLSDSTDQCPKTQSVSIQEKDHQLTSLLRVFFPPPCSSFKAQPPSLSGMQTHRVSRSDDLVKPEACVSV